ncbi:hypothetical protein PCANC_05529 [Puccinia coronata f. sp. avenae]|uniref:Uncharacterized protein n=1 Tax=Puccinia coronata f. sp. avenae TaxID=200324 RepID=A0A2N5VPE5_9BASI|nr:hypothetical protein PCANC_16556 [Puccinia coronata f. sp. avenae]PLW50088.1 hypothetical protein PCASD_01834 [Puccinia coronata f. sp. avenae]PLW51800.1 hypothetical protein PCANC_05529 [Puccinia coronata f. sp. avenae]
MGLINLNEDSKERVNQVTAVIKTILHWTWIPIVLTIGIKNSNPRPSLIKWVPPLHPLPTILNVSQNCFV